MSIEGLVSQSGVAITVTAGVPVAVQQGPQTLPDGVYKIIVSTQTDSVATSTPIGSTAPPPGIMLGCISPRGAILNDLRPHRTEAQYGGLRVTVTGGVPVAVQLGPKNLADGSYSVQEMVTNSGIQLLCTTPRYGEYAGWLDL